MSYNGLSTSEVKESLKKYGSNKLFIKKRKTFFGLLIESLGDPIIKILLISLVIKVVFLFRDADYFETLGILVAIFLSTFISTISEYGNEQAFKKLEEESNNKQVKVKRNNIIELISIDELVVGDIVFLNAGDQVYADILLLEGELSVDKSKLNGESKEENISTGEEVLRGMSIYSGKAIGRVTKVGNNTIYGSIIKELQEETPKSPLKLRLTDLAKTISKIGYIGAFLAFITYLFSKVVIANNYDIYLIKETLTNIPLMINYLIYGITLFVTIIVVAVPEGLPMMISLVLRSNMKKMLKDNVLVRKLVGIESSGSLNILYTDKTGTLTKGKLNISKIITYDNYIYNTYSDLDNDLKYRSIIEKSFIWNNDGMIIDNKIVGGNSTDVAFLKFINKNINRPQVIKDEPFNSFNKYRSITVKENNELITYYKGSEKLIDKCLYYVNKNGDIKYLLDKDKLYRIISKYTNVGKRVISLIMKKNNHCIFIGLVIIEDEIRSEAKTAISSIKGAGINVCMISGDSKETSTAIAREVGILDDDGLVLTSKELNELSDEYLLDNLTKIKVIARALPSDKSKLVRLAREKNLVVGMTGDGVNDAPALKLADASFAMGSGTDVAKNASNIVILDDNIQSISKAILYGRNIFLSIRKFIIYQLTCNFIALFLSILGPIIGVSTPITIIQMLWINMIMDTFSAIAFSYEPPKVELMKETPKKKNEKIINRYMKSEIIWDSLYAVILCVFFLKSSFISNYIRKDINDLYLLTAYFALFIFIDILNAFNARTKRINIFANLKDNPIFELIFIFILIVQLIIINYGGALFRTYGLTSNELLLVVILSLSVIPVDMVRKIFIKIKRK